MATAGGGCATSLASLRSDGRQRELVLCASRPAQTQTAELQNAFQMGEQHLDALAIAS
jgi:hypothetical protein